MIITVIGNDHRQKELAKLLNRQHDTIYLGGNEEFKKVKSILKISDVVIFPLPFTRDNKTINTTCFDIAKTIDTISKETIVFLPDYKLNEKRKVIDYNQDENFVLQNAFYTAETAVALSILNTPFSLTEAKILVLGCGRIGKTLTKLLNPFCKNVTVSARKEQDFLFLKQQKTNYIHTNEIEDLSTFNVIFNTIPQTVLSPKTILSISKDALIVDLASKNSLLIGANANYIDAKALPANYCMQSSANSLFKFIDRHLRNNRKVSEFYEWH